MTESHLIMCYVMSFGKYNNKHYICTQKYKDQIQSYTNIKIKIIILNKDYNLFLDGMGWGWKGA